MCVGIGVGVGVVFRVGICMKICIGICVVHCETTQTVSEHSLWETSSQHGQNADTLPTGALPHWLLLATGSLLPQIYPMRFSLREGPSHHQPTKGSHPPGEEYRLPHCLAMGPSEGGAPTGPPSNHWAKLMRPDSGSHLAACLLGLVRSQQHEPQVPISLFL